MIFENSGKIVRGQFGGCNLENTSLGEFFIAWTFMRLLIYDDWQNDEIAFTALLSANHNEVVVSVIIKERSLNKSLFTERTPYHAKYELPSNIQRTCETSLGVTFNGKLTSNTRQNVRAANMKVPMSTLLAKWPFRKYSIHPV